MTPADYQALFRASPYPCLVMAPDLTIMAANDAYLRAVRRTESELIGQNVFDAFIDETGSYEEIVRFIRPDNGQQIWVASHGKVQYDASRQPARVRGVTVDVTRRYQAQHMSALVDDLLDVSRVTRGLVQLNREALDIRTVVASAIAQARPLIDARRHTLAVRLPATAPDAGICVDGDRIRLVQVLVNVLGNAAKYTPQDGAITPPRLTVVAPGPAAGSAQASVGVADTRGLRIWWWTTTSMPAKRCPRMAPRPTCSFSISACPTWTATTWRGACAPTAPGACHLHRADR